MFIRVLLSANHLFAHRIGIDGKSLPFLHPFIPSELSGSRRNESVSMSAFLFEDILPIIRCNSMLLWQRASLSDQRQVLSSGQNVFSLVFLLSMYIRVRPLSRPSPCFHPAHPTFTTFLAHPSTQIVTIVRGGFQLTVPSTQMVSDPTIVRRGFQLTVSRLSFHAACE